MEKSSSPIRRRIIVFAAVLAVLAAGGFVFFPGRKKTVEKPAFPEAFTEQSVTPEADVPLSDSSAVQSAPESETVPEETEFEEVIHSEIQNPELADPFADWIPFVSVKPLVTELLKMKPKELPDSIKEPEPAPEGVIPPVVVIKSETEPETETLAVIPPVAAQKPEPETIKPQIEDTIPEQVAIKPPEVTEIATEQETEPTSEPELVAIKPPAVVLLTPDPEPEPEPPAIPIPPPISKTATLSIDSPVNGDVYHSFVNVAGRGESGESLGWTAPALDIEGRAVVGDKGNFFFSVPTSKFRGNLVISVRSGGDGAEGEEVSIQLINDNEGPSLLVKEPSNGSFYQDFLPVTGSVGPGSRDPEGVGEVESLSWKLEGSGESPRPMFFNPDGSYEFRVDMRDVKGSQNLVLTAKDLNGNETRRSFSLIDGRLEPQLVLSGPGPDDFYGAALRLWGRVDDPYAGISSLGGIESLRYEILATEAKTRDGIVTGDIPVSGDGTFDFSLFADVLQGRQNVSLILTGRNGRSRTVNVVLKQGRSAIPDFQVLSGDSSATASWSSLPLTDGYEITVTGDDDVTRRYSADNGPVEIPQLKNGELYTLKLEAVTARGRFFSHEEAVIPLSRFTLRPSVTGEYRRIQVSWPEISGSSSYTLYRSETAEGPFEIIAEDIFEPPYLDTDAQFGRNYWYAVAPNAFKSLISYAVRGTTLAAQENRLEQVAYLRGAGSGSLKIVGDYAFAASGYDGLVLYDVTESARPYVAGQVSMPGAIDVAVSGNYAFVAAGLAGLKVINIDDPTTPILIGSRLAGDAQAVALTGSYAVIADGERGLRIMDVREPSRPVRLSSTEGLSGRDVAVMGEYAFLATGEKGLVSVDISIPSEPDVTGAVNVGSLSTLVLHDNMLAASGDTGGLVLFDVSNPQNPRLLSQLHGINAVNLSFSGDFILALGEGELFVVDIRIPEEPFVFDSLPMAATSSLAVHGDDLLVSSDTGLEVYRTFLTGHSYVTGSRDLPGRAYSVESDSGEFLISAHSGGLVVLDSDSLEVVDEIDSDFAVQTAISGPWLFLADGYSGLRVFQRDNLSAGPVVSFENLGNVSDVISSGGSVYAASADRGILMLRPGLPGSSEPEIIGAFPMKNCRVLSAAGGYVYASDGRNLVSFVELPDAPPREVGRVTLPDVTSLDAESDLIATSGAEGITLLETDRTGRMSVVSTIPQASAATVEIDGNRLYVSGGYQGFSIYDISTASRPVLLTSCPDVFALSTVVDGDTAYSVDGKGIRKVQIFIPEWLH